MDTISHLVEEVHYLRLKRCVRKCPRRQRKSSKNTQNFVKIFQYFVQLKCILKREENVNLKL